MHANDFIAEHRRYLTRRWFFRDCGVGLGSMALASLLSETASGTPAADPMHQHRTTLH